ncbi:MULTISPECIES: cytochrome P450 family protein [Catenuloplanes]|uniref:Cytochrome P450 n=1 Tax=Catenuloplanes niger TaxID=587534 RepID=A0AAE3ZV22_9ACTN|nr:hypothetical protein [Catenuloplanes niger]MDR7325472.1 hypothetical protein [Catenuloplanes niger]
MSVSGTAVGAPRTESGRTERRRPPRATARDTVRVLTRVLAPGVARGVVVPRPWTGRLGLDRFADAEINRLRDRYGLGPLRLAVPGRSVALILDEGHARRVLSGEFPPVGRERRSALAHYTFGSAPAHQTAGSPDAEVEPPGDVERIVREEIRPLAADGTIGWDEVRPALRRAVRRIVLGDTARDDELLTGLLDRLRTDANWGYLRRRRDPVRWRFLARIRAHLRRAGRAEGTGTVPESLVERAPLLLAELEDAGAVAYRALGLLAAHPGAPAEARADVTYLQAAVREARRLWPDEPAVLRDTRRKTRWDGAELPAGTTLVVPTVWLHRPARFAPVASTLPPDPALRTATAMIKSLIDGYDVRPAGPGGLIPMPRTLHPSELRFSFRRARE